MYHLTNDDLQNIEDHFLLLKENKSHVNLEEWVDNLAANLGINIEMPKTAEAMILIAEGLNLAAKTIDEGFYSAKPAAIRAAIELGAEGGWGEDGAFYLSSRETGVACFHDPMDQIGLPDLSWSESWSGIVRQGHAFSIISNKAVRDLIAQATHPQGRLYGCTDGQVNKWIARLTG